MQGGKPIPSPGSLFLLILYLILQLGGQLSAKAAGVQPTLFSGFMILSYFCLLTRGFLWVLILSRLRLVAAYPLNGLAYVLILPLSSLVFGETVTPAQAAGGVLILAGIICIARGEPGHV